MTVSDLHQVNDWPSSNPFKSELGSFVRDSTLTSCLPHVRSVGLEERLQAFPCPAVGKVIQVESGVPVEYCIPAVLGIQILELCQPSVINTDNTAPVTPDTWKDVLPEVDSVLVESFLEENRNRENIQGVGFFVRRNLYYHMRFLD